MISFGKKTIITASLFIVILSLILLMAFRNSGKQEENVRAGFSSDTVYAVAPVRIPDSVTFAGERMPLENIDTRESLERELLISVYRHSATILIIKKSARYLPEISAILKKNNIPDDFKYLVAAESDFSNAVSPAGATGFWQIMAGSGREKGMEVNQVVDERYHLAKSTQFACDFFSESYRKFGNWTLTAASYNNGRAGLAEQITIQRQNNYYDLLLNEETARYVFRAVAYKLIINDPAGYGFNVEPADYYPEFKYHEVSVDTVVNDFTTFAKGYATNYKMLKLLNPWLRKPYLKPVPGKVYTIRIPENGMRSTKTGRP